MVDEIKPDSPAPRPRWPFTRRQVFAQIGVAVVILISGMGIGTGGTVLTLKDRIMWHFPPPRGPRPDPNEIVRMWQTDYGLTDDQARQAKEAFMASLATTRKLFEELGQKQQAEQAKFAEAMKTILTPEQYQKWDQEFKARAERFHRMRPGGRPGGHPGGPGEHNGRRPDHDPSRGNRGFGPPPGPGPGGPEPAAPGEGGFQPAPPPQE